MLLPEKMTKVLIVGSKAHLKDTIDLLYSMETVHPIDFSAEEEGFSLGSPMPTASDVSQKLLKLRAAEKDLDIEGKETKEKVQVSRIYSELDKAIIKMETELAGAVDSKNNLQSRIHDLQNQKKLLEPFQTLSINLDLYRGYKRIVVFTGAVRSDPESQLSREIKDYEFFKSNDGKFIAVFVTREEASEAQRILVQNGFTETPAPVRTGSPMDAAKSIDDEIASLQKSLDEANVRLSELKKENETFILASDEELSIQVDKAEFPLRVGTSGHTFVIDAWVPLNAIDELKRALQAKIGDGLSIEVLETVPRREHIHPEEAYTGASKEHVQEEAPTKIDQKKPIGFFSYLTALISTPKYGEIDPTVVIAITFPIFFGLMVGDVGYGVPFILLGILGLRKCRSKEWRTISTMLLFGGIWATLFGMFLFGEAFGMHFSPQWVPTTASHTQYPYGNELSWSSLLGTNLPQIGIISKLNNVKLFLYITIWIGFAHLLLGYAIGIYNETIRHGFKHAFFHKIGWTMILLGGVFLFPWILDLLILNKPVGVTSPLFILGIGLIIPGIIISIKGEGGSAILELPALVSNVVSYTRLAAIGMAKAGMALAFNMIAIEMIAPAGGIAIIAGMLIFMVGHLMIFILAILSAGIHGIRLHYVELFQKFFEGGGLEFNPLKIVRKYTSER
jgi:V/A-type H+-transporting ATPase subunit I